MKRDYSFNSVEVIPDLQASAAFTAKSSEVFKEQSDMNPIKIAYLVLKLSDAKIENFQ